MFVLTNLAPFQQRVGCVRSPGGAAGANRGGACAAEGAAPARAALLSVPCASSHVRFAHVFTRGWKFSRAFIFNLRENILNIPFYSWPIRICVPVGFHV